MDGGAPWAQDVQIQTTKALTTTGGTVWDAAWRAAQYLESMTTAAGLQRPGIRILELGAGCGLLGMLLARNLPDAAEICLTEQAYGGALDHLRSNVKANRHLPNMKSVTLCACDWAHFLDPKLLKALRQSGQAHGDISDVQGAASITTDQVQPPEQLQRLQVQHQEQQQQQQQQQLLQHEQQKGQQRQQQRQQQLKQYSPQATPSQQLPDPPGCSLMTAAERADMHKLLSTPWDIIVGSDLVYNTAGACALPKLLAALMPPQHTSKSSSSDSHGEIQQQCAQHHIAAAAPACQPTMYYAHTKHRYDAIDIELFKQLEGQGLVMEEVVEHGQELPPPSPPPLTTLYPEHRCAMFRISRPVRP